MRRLVLCSLLVAGGACDPADPVETARHVYVGVTLTVEQPSEPIQSELHWFVNSGISWNRSELAETYLVDYYQTSVPLPNGVLQLELSTPRITQVGGYTLSHTVVVGERQRTDQDGFARWVNIDYVQLLLDNGVIDRPNEVVDYLPAKDFLRVRFGFEASTGYFSDGRVEAQLTAAANRGPEGPGDEVQVSWDLASGNETSFSRARTVQAVCQVGDRATALYQPLDLTTRGVVFFGVQQALQRFGHDLDMGPNTFRCAAVGCGRFDHLEAVYPTTWGQDYPDPPPSVAPSAHRILLDYYGGRDLYTVAHEVGHTLQLNAWERDEWTVPGDYGVPPEWTLNTPEGRMVAAREGLATFLGYASLVEPHYDGITRILSGDLQLEADRLTGPDCARMPFNSAAFFWKLYQRMDADGVATSSARILRGWDSFPDGSPGCGEHTVCEPGGGTMPDWRANAEPDLVPDAIDRRSLDRLWADYCHDQ